MARLIDPETLSCYRNALANWSFIGYVDFSPLAAEWLRRELKEAQRDFARRLYEFVRAGGEIDQVVETRPEWNVWSHHYDLRPTVNGQVLYVETRLRYSNPSDPDDPVITVVNIHRA
jgi:hypothetical protein